MERRYSIKGICLQKDAKKDPILMTRTISLLQTVMEKTLLHKIWRGYKMAYIKEGHIFCDAR
jgi:hypothetical protein